MRPAGSLNYMPALDGLRAVAVLLVFLEHAFPEVGFPGSIGVDVFFVISGFLITRIILTQHSSGSFSLKRFYLNRLVRLYPALLVMVGFFGIAWFTLGLTFGRVASYSGAAVLYVSNLVVSFTDASMGHLRHTWSLALEEQFYLVWPLVLLFVLARRWSNPQIALLAFGGAAVSLLAWFMLPGQPYSPVTHASGILIGCAVACMVQGRKHLNAPAAYVSALVIAAVMLLEYLDITGREWTMPVVVICSPWIVLHAAFGKGWMVRALSSPWLVYVGAVSYAVYLWHYPVIYALNNLTNFGEPVVAVIALVVTFAAAELSRRLVEQPAAKLKQYVARRSQAGLSPVKEGSSSPR